MIDKANTAEAVATIQQFIVDELARAGLEGYVIGLSGGIDSSLSASLAVRAVGAARVFGVMMPYKTSSGDSLRDARALAEQLGVQFEVIDISPMIDAYYGTITDENRLRAGNKMARERMSILFDIAHKMNCLVLGTGNRTEICLGYTTLYGDAACSINPVGDLYKTEIRLLAKELGIPESILSKPPSADLWENQTDEGEIGVTYDVIDSLLRRLVDDSIRSLSQLMREGFDAKNIDRVITLLNGNAFKRRLPAIAPLGKPTIPDSIKLSD